MASELVIRLLGGLSITQNGASLAPFLSHKVPALLAYLALTHRAHSREALAALLWGELPDADAKNNLRQALSNLRKLAEPHVLINRDTVEFNVNTPYFLDVEAFERKARAEATADLQEAAVLYAGDFLAGFAVRDAPEFEEWALAQKARLRELALLSLQTLTQQHLAHGDYRHAIDDATRLLALDAWREKAHRQLMLALARSGQRSAALAQYETCRRILEKELGVEPSAETQALYQRIRAASRRVHLPPAATPFVGRVGELADIARLLADPTGRLITLSGPGGCGKTRLALEAAARAADVFLHGACFVPLAATGSLEVVPSTIAEALGLTLSGKADPRDQLLTHLGDKDLLLVLDNLEHLPEADEWVGRLAQACPEVRLLVTSRERLNLHGERLIELGGLDVPPGADGEAIADYSAAQLFLNSARDTLPNFALDAENALAVVRVCQLVNGLPLAIELAAVWVRHLNCHEIADEIERNLSFLATTQKNVPARHRSLQAAFEHSWALLADDERRVFARLAVFRGGCDREAALAVTHGQLPALAALCDKSLLRRDAAGRYSIHELLRQYAESKLRAGPEAFLDAQARHAEYYARFLQQRETDLNGPRQKEALDEIAAEIENVRAAWSWAVERGEEHAIDISAEGLYLFYRMRGYFQEGAEMFGRAAEGLTGAQATARGDEHDLIVGKVLARHGTFWYHLGRFREADVRLQQSLTTLRRLDARGELAFALKHLGDIARVLGNYAEASRFLEEAIEIRAHVGDRPGQAFALLSLAGVAAFEQGDYERARRLCEEGLAICREAGDRQAVAQFLTALGIVAQTTGDYAAAASLLRECLATYQALNEPNGAALTLYNLALVARALGEHTQASQLCQESLTVYREIGDQSGVAECLTTLGEIACASGRAAYQDSENYFHSALRVARDTQETPVMLNALAGLAILWVKQEKWEQALELADLIQRHPATSQETRDRAAQLLAQLEAQLPAPIMAAAQERGRVRKLEEVAAEILEWAQAKLEVQKG